MKVVGLSRKNSASPTFPLPSNPFNAVSFRIAMPCFSTSRSAIAYPMLWRVWTYSGPGLPNPTIKKGVFFSSILLTFCDHDYNFIHRRKRPYPFRHFQLGKTFFLEKIKVFNVDNKFRRDGIRFGRAFYFDRAYDLSK